MAHARLGMAEEEVLLASYGVKQHMDEASCMLSKSPSNVKRVFPFKETRIM